MEFPLDWQDRPGIIHLQPEIIGDVVKNPLIIYDCSLLCGQSVLESILSPINSAGFCMPVSIALWIGASILEEDSKLVSLILSKEKPIGKCIFESWLVAEGLRSGVNRFEYTSAIMYLKAVVGRIIEYGRR